MRDENPETATAAGPPAPRHGSTPPRPPLAFRVGVVGHRPNRLGHADLAVLAGTLQDILRAVQCEVETAKNGQATWYADTLPVLRAISPLAEGVDRLFAEQALDLGFELCCVMPFPQSEFERDFSPEVALEEGSLERFHGLLDRAEKTGSLTRFELDGRQEDKETAYGVAGRVVLNQSDILVVVWDGERQGKSGGTEDTFGEALGRGVPVIWVDAHSPHGWQILDPAHPLPNPIRGQRAIPDGRDSRARLQQWVQDLLKPPEVDAPLSAPPENRKKDEDPQRQLKEFYAEGQPKWNPAIIWKCFRDIIGDGSFPRINLRVKPFEDAVIKNWPRDRATPIARLLDQLRPYYAWPDQLAVLYADRYRSTFILAFLLAAFAVALALLPVGISMELHLNRLEKICVFIEFLVILEILVFVHRARVRRWHGRWIDYRLTAELVRHLRLVAPLGGTHPFPRIPAHWGTYGRPGATWMAWYVRAVERALGLPPARLNRSHLAACLSHLVNLLDDQSGYHEANARRCHGIEQRLHWFGNSFFILTFILCGVHLLYGFLLASPESSWLWAHLLTFFNGFFPAIGAALAGINNQGEFLRIAKRSEAMQGHLKLLLNAAEELGRQLQEDTTLFPQQLSIPLAALTANAARLLVNEVLDWRVIFLDRPLNPTT